MASRNPQTPSATPMGIAQDCGADIGGISLSRPTCLQRLGDALYERMLGISTAVIDGFDRLTSRYEGSVFERDIVQCVRRVRAMFQLPR